MQVPVKLILALKPSVAPALLVAIASSTVVFVSTPFLLAGIAEERNISVGTVGWVSTAQLAGFVIASWAAGKFLRPVRSVFVVGASLGIVANLASAIAPNLVTLAGTRGLSGISLGLAAWFGWQAAFVAAGDSEMSLSSIRCLVWGPGRAGGGIGWASVRPKQMRTNDKPIEKGTWWHFNPVAVYLRGPDAGLE